MTITSTTTTDRPRRSVLDRDTALRLAATEYGRYLDQLRSLGPDDWSRPTDCPAWDVRAMASHNLGMAEMAGSLPEMVRQFTAAATGHPLVLTPEHDGVLVADLVNEWAARHGAPFRLHLTGPAGGRWSSGRDGEELELDAVLFARTLSGRVAGHGLVAVHVPF